jgi:hypothetical protein
MILLQPADKRKAAGWGSGSLRCIKTDLWKERINAFVASVLFRLQE